ncbi:MAG TPA: trypsin-like peptidase domain-containing protein [Mycobacteriales bacterium]|nr:trypsin-like peptidase domain-containing protein [Mycobacteriales bacterium]
MSDLFWPPVSGGDEDGGRSERADEPVGATAAEHRTEPLFAEPLAGGAGGGGDAGPTWQRSEPPSDGPRRRWGVLPVAAITAFVFGAGGVAVGAELINNGGSDNPPSAGLSVSTASPTSLATIPRSYAKVAAQVLPSVVSINVTTSGGGDSGSGVVVRSNGYILTNNHVVSAAGNGGSVSVTFNDGSTSKASIVGTDPLDDLAVIKVDKSGLTPANLGDSAQLQVGDPVLAVGSPLGLSGTVTSGIVSALNRPVQTQEETPQQQNPFGFGFGNGGSQQQSQPTVIDAIQTDAAINPGNSGGALVNMAGQVIGINSAIATLGSSDLGGQSGNIGVGFAIPINQARTIAGELINTGHAEHPLLGVTLTDATNSDGSTRAVVHSVTSGGPADKAGIKAGDVITAVDGQATEGADAVIADVRSHQPGERVTVTVERGGSTKHFTVTLTQQSSQNG